MQLAVDLECNGLYREATKIHCIVAKDMAEGTVYEFYGNRIEEGVTFLSKASLIVGHNFIGFDMRVIEKLYKIKLDIKKIVDTYILSLMDNKYNRKKHSLESWGEELGEMKKEHEDWTVFTPEMLARCKSDVEITHRLFKQFDCTINN